MKDLAKTIAAWAARDDSILAVALIGSRVRNADDAIWRADAQSDWDFQVIAERPEVFADATWAQAIGLTVHAYAVRRAAIGGIPKVAALFAEGEADFVIMPKTTMEPLRQAVQAGRHRSSPELRKTLQDLSVVVRPGWRFLKGAETWEPFYRQVVVDVPDPRLSDAEVRNLAEGFVCDAVWVQRKVERGELLAAQRMLHRALAETNFQLWHELRLRRGERTFPEARRFERIGSEAEIAALTVAATLEPTALRAAAAKAAATCRELVHALVGDSWRWPPGR